MELANNVITLIGNIIGCGVLLAFMVGLIFGIKFMIQAKKQDKEEYERKKKKDELDYKESELRLILSILVYTFFTRMFDLMLPLVVKHSIVAA